MKRIRAALKIYEEAIKRIEHDTNRALDVLNLEDEAERDQYLRLIEEAGFHIQQEEQVLISEILKDKKINRAFSVNDLELEIGVLRPSTEAYGAIVPAKYIEELILQLREKEDQHEIYIPVGIGASWMLRDYPDGFEFGNSIIITPESLPEALLKKLSENEQLKQFPRWVKTTVDIPGPERASLVGEAIITEDFDIHRFSTSYPWERVLGREPPIVFCYSPSTGSITHTRTPRVFVGTYTRVKRSKKLDYFIRLSRLRKDASGNKMANRLQRALSFIGLAQSSIDDRLKYGLLVAALEALVIPTQRDYQLGRTFAQFCAILSADIQTERLMKYNYFKNAYQLRSEVFHGQRPEISTQECVTLLRHCQHIFWKVLDLYESGGIITHEALQEKLENSMFSDNILTPDAG